MNNVSIKKKEINDLNRHIELKNGSLVVLKSNEEVIGTYMVIPFRDHKNEHQGCSTSGYCHFADLDTGRLIDKRRYDRRMTEKDIIDILLLEDETCRVFEEYYKRKTISVYLSGDYKMEIELLQEVI